MQVVYVLSDHAAGFALSDQFRDRKMSGVRLRADPSVLIAEAAAPCFASRLRGCNEILKIDGLHPGPDASRTSKIWNTGFGADACAREKHGVTARVEQFSEG